MKSKKKKKIRNMIKNINSKQTNNQTSNNITQTKAGNNSNKLKNEIRQIRYLLYQHNKITKNVYNSLMK